jgi:hypothetical protein
MIQVWPFQFTNCRSSSQMEHEAGGALLSGNWAPHCSQVQKGMGVTPLENLAGGSCNADAGRDVAG